jgi:HEAT repeat protein
MSNARKNRAQDVNLKTVLHALVDAENVFPAAYIHKLSNLTHSQAKQVEKIWAQVPLERRRSLLEDMEEFISSDFLLNYTPIAHLAISDVDGKVRASAVQILAADEEKANIPIFSYLLNHDPDEAVRASAASAFSPLVYAGELEELSADLLHQVEEALLAKLNSNDAETVRQNALEALGYSSRPELPDLLRTAYESGVQNWRISALFAMGHSASEEWAPQVLASLQDQRPLVRAEAAFAAGELELQAAIPTLMSLLDDASLEVRSACIVALSKTGGEGVRDRLEQLLDESEDDDEIDSLEEALENLDFNEEFFPLLFDLNASMDDEEAPPEDEEDDDLPPALGRSPSLSKN